MINVLRPLANSEEKVYLCVGICGLYAMTLYEMMLNREVLTDTYVLMLTELEQMINYFGLSTAIYTQTTDVEHEINGLVTYDRKVEKMDLEKVKVHQSGSYKMYKKKK